MTIGTPEKFDMEDILSGKYGLNQLKVPSTTECLTFDLTKVSQLNLRGAVAAWNRRVLKPKGQRFTVRKDGALKVRVYLLNLPKA